MQTPKNVKRERGRIADTGGDENGGSDARDLFRLPSTDVLLLKVSTWVGW